MKRATIALLLLPFASQAFALELTDYVGQWKGTGTYTTKGLTESSGRLTCRLDITAPTADVIVISGRCAAPAGARSFKTQVTKTGEGSITGLELSTAEPRTSAGRLNSGGLRLDGADSKGPFFFQLSSPTSGAMEMHSSSTTANRTEAAEVSLTRTK